MTQRNPFLLYSADDPWNPNEKFQIIPPGIIRLPFECSDVEGNRVCGQGLLLYF
jgi:hypothetical protein